MELVLLVPSSVTHHKIKYKKPHFVYKFFIAYHVTDSKKEITSGTRRSIGQASYPDSLDPALFSAVNPFSNKRCLREARFWWLRGPRQGRGSHVISALRYPNQIPEQRIVPAEQRIVTAE
eukprot:1546675-Rhodomonas_salina.1